MPQMAPMMWQMIFLSTTAYMMISISKNYFMEVNKTISMGNKVENENVKTNWKW